MRRNPLFKIRLTAALSIAAGLLAASLWLHAQLSDTRPLASLLPPGALLYLEAKNFHGLVDEWNASPEKARWLKSTNYDTVSRSRLIQRLSQAQEEFARVAGIPVGMPLLGQVAGGRSAFAFYNLSAVTFVYISELPQSRLENTNLWRGRAAYQPRQVAGIAFYVKAGENGTRTVAFASYKDWLVLATDENRMAETLVLLSGQKAASIATEPWYTSATKASATPGDLRLVYHLTPLLATPQFRTYWLQRNVSELKQFSAGISDLFDRSDAFEEQRVLLRATEIPAPPLDSSLSDALAYAPLQASLHRAWSMPDRAHISEVLQQVIFGERPTSTAFNAPAPKVTPEAGAVGTESDLEVRIDEPPFQRASEDSVAPLVNAVIAMQPTALLHVQTTVVLARSRVRSSRTADSY